MPGMVHQPRLLVAALFLLSTARALEFSPIFSDNMVLQREPYRASLYGSGASPGATVSVTVKRAATDAATATATADADGTWAATLAKAMPAGGNFSVTVSTPSASATISGVTFGEVFLCSGQSNMELSMHFTFSRNQTYEAIRKNPTTGLGRDVRILHLDHNPRASPQYVLTKEDDAALVLTPWATFGAALGSGEAQNALDRFSGTCAYFGESLYTMVASEETGSGTLSRPSSSSGSSSSTPVPVGLIESAFGGTMIESWVPAHLQIPACTNITCTSMQPTPFNTSTEAACLAQSGEGGLGAKGAGANGELWNGMIAPFTGMALKGFVWYQGENNLPYHAGNVIDRAGYACMLPLLISSWRAAWRAAAGDGGDGIFGIVTLADSTDEGWGSNVPQMHWAETGNYGYAPNPHLPGTFMATAHDLADPWDDGCNTGAKCCVDTGSAPDARCNLKHRGWLVQNGEYPGVSEPVTPTMGLTIHPRIKRQIGERLARAAFALYYGGRGGAMSFVGPVLSGCSYAGGGSTDLRIKFNGTLLRGDGEAVVVADYNKTEMASVMWVLVGPARPPADAGGNFKYANRAPWWGDSGQWVNVDIGLEEPPKEPKGPKGQEGEQEVAAMRNLVVVAKLPPAVLRALEGGSSITAVRYGHMSPKGHPQSGHDKICCGKRDFAVDPCAPESCPISSSTGLPAMPFHANLMPASSGDGLVCECLAPQSCDEVV